VAEEVGTDDVVPIGVNVPTIVAPLPSRKNVFDRKYKQMERSVLLHRFRDCLNALGISYVWLSLRNRLRIGLTTMTRGLPLQSLRGVPDRIGVHPENGLLVTDLPARPHP